MNEIFYSVTARKAGASTRKPAALKARFPKDTSVEGGMVTAVQRHSCLGHIVRKLKFSIPEGVNLETDDGFIATVVFGSGKKYADAPVKIIRRTDKFGKWIHFQIAL